MAEEATPEQRIYDLLSAEEGEHEGAPEPVEEPEQASAEPEEPAQTEPQEPEKAETGEDTEEIEIASFADLAEHLGVDVGDLYQIPINLSGDKGSVPLGEIKDKLQEAEDIRARQAEIEQLSEQRNEELQRFAQATQQATIQGNALINMAEQELARDYQSVNWQELRQYDPAEYAAKQQEFQQRNQQIQGAKQQALQQQQQWSMQQAEMMQQQLPEQEKQLAKLVPEFADPKTASVEKPKVAEYLGKFGFNPQEISGLYDARQVALAYKAMKYDELQNATPSKKKVLKVGGKPIKPGKASSKADKRTQASSDARMRLKKSGSVHDMAAILNSDEYLGDIS